MIRDDLYGLNIWIFVGIWDRRNRELDSRYPINSVLQLRCVQRCERRERTKVINVICSVPVSHIYRALPSETFSVNNRSEANSGACFTSFQYAVASRSALALADILAQVLTIFETKLNDLSPCVRD